MKKRTVIVVYTDKKNLSTNDIASLKRYAFNVTDERIQVGTILKSKDYTTHMQVVKTLDHAYTYYNASTGELNDEFFSSAQWYIKDIEIQDRNASIVYASIVE